MSKLRVLKLNPTRKVGVWGACFDQGQRHPGASEGPDVIRSSGLLQKLSVMGVEVEDHGDVRVERSADHDNLENRQRATAKFSHTMMIYTMAYVNI